MRILVACEESQEVTKAFRDKGHEAFSCDLIECSGNHPEWHLQVDVLTILDEKWDMMLAFPPCTFVCNSGIGWNACNPDRKVETEQAINFARKLFEAKIAKVCIENSVGQLSRHFGKPTQIIQPYFFGEDASKRTCLWLKGLKKLVMTEYIPPRFVNGYKRWSNQTDSGHNKLGPSIDRAKIRSKTYPGVAKAMAAQWG